MPTKKKIKNKVSGQFNMPNKAKMLLSSFSVPAFLLTVIIGTTSMFGAGVALYKTAPPPNYESWPYVEIRIATISDQTLDAPTAPEQAHDNPADATAAAPEHSEEHPTGTETPEQGEEVPHVTAEYGTEEDNKYKVDLSHDENLYSTIDNGINVPRRNGRDTVFNAYKAPLFEELKSRQYKGMISLVMVNYGLSQDTSIQAEEAFKDLHITYALSPYALNPQDKLDQARKNGHEVWLGLPLQSKHFPWNETGPMTLLIKSKANENRRRLIWLLSLVRGYPGVMDVQESFFTTSESEMNNLFSALRQHGVAYITSDDAPEQSLAESIARTAKVPFYKNDLWLTKEGRIDDLDKKLEELTKRALAQSKTSSAVAFFHPYPKVIERISQWAKQTAKQQGLIFVPVSYNMTEYK